MNQSTVPDNEFLKTVVDTFEQEEKANRPNYDVKSTLLDTKPFPPLVQVGLTNVCNLKCEECYHPKYKDQTSYQQNFMSMAIFKKIVDEVSGFPPESVFRLLGKGESLLHPDFIEMMKYAKGRLSQSVACISNGICLDESYSTKILDTGIDVIDFSLDAFTKEAYGRVRSDPEKFQGLIENINRFIEMRNSGGYTTKVFVSFMLQPENYKELEAFKDYWEPRVDKILYRKYHTYSGKIPKKPTPYRDRTPCPALWNRININEKGLITVCYVDWDDNYILADLNRPDVSILSIWRGDEFQKAREDHLKSNYCGLCENCEGWQTAHWTISYEQAVRMTENQ